MSIGRDSFILIDLPERGLGEYYDLKEDMRELGYDIRLVDIFEMGVFAIRQVGRHAEKLVDVATVIYQGQGDMFDPEADVELVNELLFLATETAYYDLVNLFHQYHLNTAHVSVVGVSESGIMLEV